MPRRPDDHEPATLPIMFSRPGGRHGDAAWRAGVCLYRCGVAAADVMVGVMVLITRLFADHQDHARFEDVESPLTPVDPPPDGMSVSQPWPASAVLLGTGETRSFGPGDVLLVEDTEGSGHSSRTGAGFVAAFIPLAPPRPA